MSFIEDRYTNMKRKKGIIIGVLSVLLIIAIWIFGDTYSNARGQYTKGHDQSVKIAKEKADLSSVDYIETFNGKTKYHIVAGENTKSEKVFVWIPQSKKGNILVKKQKSGITEEQAVKNVKNEYNLKEILNVQLGIDENIPVWEVKYIDEFDRFTYDFVNFYDGKIQKHMAIRNDEKS